MIRHMREIELKLIVPPSAIRAVERTLQARQRTAASADKTTARPQHLAAAYFDTPERHLARSGMALRVRKEGSRWVQTLKAGGPNALERLEHNVPLRVPRRNASHPSADPQRHAGTPAGEALLRALSGAQPDSALVELYRTDIQRRTRNVHMPHGTLELALDTGHIVAGPHNLAVHELEIELIRGAPQAVIAQARHWVQSHGLWLDTHTKAHRGDHLARGVDPAPAKATFAALSHNITLNAAWQQIHTTLLDALLDNASTISQGRCTPEHVRALRVGLRRLRSTWKLFAPLGLAPQTHTLQSAQTLYRRLGLTRDGDVLATLWSALSPAMQAAGCPDLPAPDCCTPAKLSATEILREPATSMLWLDLLDITCSAPAASVMDAPAAPLIGERLRRWHRQASKTAQITPLPPLGHEPQGNLLGDDALHELRKQLKRLRDGIELGLAFLPDKAAQRHLRVLRQTQDALGALNDLLAAHERLMLLQPSTEHAGCNPRVWFVLGWINARLNATRQAAIEAIRQWHRAPKFWR